MSVSSSDNGLLTPGNCTIVVADFQEHFLPGLPNVGGDAICGNVLLLIKAAKIFGIPLLVTTIEASGISGRITPRLLEALPGPSTISRSSLNAWDDTDFVAAVRKTGRRNLVIAARWSEVALTMTALHALTDGFGVYAVIDASGAASPTAHQTSFRRIEQAGAVSVTAIQVLLELQRDWSKAGPAAEILEVIRAHFSARPSMYHESSDPT